MIESLVRNRLWIDGGWHAAHDGGTIAVINPATEDFLTEVCRGRAADAARAVDAARRAFEKGPWPSMKASRRAGILFRLADLLLEKKEDFARLETLDSGKPYRDSLEIDIPSSAEALRYYAGWADKLAGETLAVDPGYLSFTLREPLGVVGLITPWNFPLLMAVQKSAAALAAGNTVVLKPAEQTPLSALLFAELTAEAGLPAGVFNVVTGYGEEAGAALVSHPGVDGIAFTGEYRTGMEIMRNAAPTLKRVSFELGGKSPNIVFADADLDAAARFACEGAFFNQGEVCCAGSRLFVEESIKEPFMERVLQCARDWQPGDPWKPEARLGAIVSREQYEKIESYIRKGEEEGGRLVCDGRMPRGKGFFLGPTIFQDVDNTAVLAQEEIFGPVLAQINFRSFDEVIAQANQTFYGLAASVWTRDMTRALNAARKLKAGTVWINCYGTSDHALPFGGYKMSGAGREGGIQTFDFYTQVKTVWASLQNGKEHS